MRLLRLRNLGGIASGDARFVVMQCRDVVAAAKGRSGEVRQAAAERTERAVRWRNHITRG